MKTMMRSWKFYPSGDRGRKFGRLAIACMFASLVGCGEESAFVLDQSGASTQESNAPSAVSTQAPEADAAAVNSSPVQGNLDVEVVAVVQASNSSVDDPNPGSVAGGEMSPLEGSVTAPESLDVFASVTSNRQESVPPSEFQTFDDERMTDSFSADMGAPSQAAEGPADPGASGAEMRDVAGGPQGGAAQPAPDDISPARDPSAAFVPPMSPVAGGPNSGSPAAAIEPRWVQQCNKKSSGDVPLVHLSGREQSLNLRPGEGLAVKATGNQNSVIIAASQSVTSLDSSQWKVIPVLCVFVAGNKNNIDVDVAGVHIGQIVVVGRGNDPQVRVNLGDDVAVRDWNVDFKCNKGSMTVEGAADSTPKMCAAKGSGKRNSRHKQVQCMASRSP
jgi:hypothetical protein